MKDLSNSLQPFQLISRVPPCRPGGSPHGFGEVLPVSVLFSYLQGRKRVLTPRPDSAICFIGLILFRSFILSPFYRMLAFHVNHAREISGAVIYRWNKEAEAQRRPWGCFTAEGRIAVSASSAHSEASGPPSNSNQVQLAFSSIWSNEPSGEFKLFPAILLLSVLRWQRLQALCVPLEKPPCPSTCLQIPAGLSGQEEVADGEAIASHLGPGKTLLAALTLLRVCPFYASSTPGQSVW